jgi:hypothetical protein
MTILLTGGSGKTSTRLASLLHTHNVDFLLASRKPSSSITPDNHVQFDWTDSSTWPTAFPTPIRAVYMMEPQAAQPWVPMISFLDFAISKGATRFVLCAGTTAERGKDGMGRVWDAFVERGVEFCVLRPSWFMGMCQIPERLHKVATVGLLDVLISGKRIWSNLVWCIRLHSLARSLLRVRTARYRLLVRMISRK